MASKMLRCYINRAVDLGLTARNSCTTSSTVMTFKQQRQFSGSRPETARGSTAPDITESRPSEASPDNKNELDLGLLKLSEACVKKLKDMDSDKHLRLTVEGGGCSGFQYTFQMDTSLNPDDIVIEKAGVSVVFDKDSLEFIKGSTLDYHEELIRSSFRVINNPQAELGCSCGASFALKL